MTNEMYAPTPMTRWQYHLVEGRWDERFLARLNALGAQGWAAVGITQGPTGPKVLVGRAY